MMGKG